MKTSDESSVLIQKIMRVSTINAWSVLFIAGTFAVLSMLALSFPGVAVGVAVAIAGPLELHGQKRLEDNPMQARTWMMGSQLWLMTCVLIYCSWRVLSLDPDNPFVVFGDAAQVFELVQIFGIPRAYLASLFVQAFYITYGLIAGLTLIFQGGLTLYYRARIGRLAHAISATDSVRKSATVSQDA